MMSEHRSKTWLLLMVLATAGPVLAARQGRLVGKVVDPEGKPVAGVTVTATSKDFSEFHEVTITDGKGIFMVDFERIGVVYTYRLEKAGYKATQVNQTWNVMGTERHQFTLERGDAPAAALDQAPPPTTSNQAATAFNEGVRAYEAKDYPAARAKLEQALQHDSGLRQAWSMLSQVHLEQKRYKEAAEAADKAIALGTGGPAILRARWEAYRHLGDAARTQQAREELEKAGHLEEEAKRIHNTGVALSKIGNDAEAYAKFEEAVRIDPNLEQSWLALAVTGLKIGRAAEAAAAAKKLLESNARHEEALRLQYNAALKVGDEGKIVDALVALAAIEPTTARDNLFKLALRAFEADNAARAKGALVKVLELDPNHPGANYYLGVLFVREGAKTDARTHLQRFLRLAPNHPEANTAKGLLSHIGN